MARQVKPSHTPKPQLRVWLFSRRQRAWRARIAIASMLLALVIADRHGLLLHRPDWRRFHQQWALVTAVLDGDTLDIITERGEEARVRLCGIDAPEIAQPEWGRPGERFGEEAKLAAREWCENTRVRLMLQAHQMRDRFGRLLAYVVLEDGTILNELLLTAGLARYDGRFSHDLVERYALLEQQARFDGVGIWQSEGSHPAAASGE